MKSSKDFKNKVTKTSMYKFDSLLIINSSGIFLFSLNWSPQILMINGKSFTFFVTSPKLQAKQTSLQDEILIFALLIPLLSPVIYVSFTSELNLGL